MLAKVKILISVASLAIPRRPPFCEFEARLGPQRAFQGPGAVPLRAPHSLQHPSPTAPFPKGARCPPPSSLLLPTSSTSCPPVPPRRWTTAPRRTRRSPRPSAYLLPRKTGIRFSRTGRVLRRTEVARAVGTATDPWEAGRSTATRRWITAGLLHSTILSRGETRGRGRSSTTSSRLQRSTAPPTATTRVTPSSIITPSTPTCTGDRAAGDPPSRPVREAWAPVYERGKCEPITPTFG